MKKRTIAQTPAPAKDIIKGSTINKKLSATKEGASTIELSERTIKVLQDKLKAFKEKHPNNTTVTLNDLKAVYRRGSGAYSTSHRPNITRAGWSYARVNKFLEKAGGNKVKEAYVQDDDLLKYMKGGKVLNKADKMGKQIICKNCGWKWNTDKSDEHNKYICHKCNFDNRTFYDSDPIGYANGGIIDSLNFKNWFTNSKVVDYKNKPLIVYHGSPDLRGIKSEYIFKTSWEKFDENESKNGAYYFTDNYNMAKSYADPKRAFDYQGAEEGVMELYLSLQNPLIVDGKNQIWRKFETTFNSEQLIGTKDVISYAKKNNYDGVIVKNIRDYYNDNVNKKSGGNVYVAFQSNQIKLADGTNTTFDPNNPDIRYKQGGKVKTYWYKGLFN
jgi:hypothetical protein